MTTTQERVNKSEGLTVYKINDGKYLVDSGNGKLAYKITVDKNFTSCTCADFINKVKSDPDFTCKHIIAVNSRNGDEEEIKPLENRTPRINPKFIMNLQGKDFVLYSGLLDLAHQKGLMKLDVEIVQHPAADNGNEAVINDLAITLV